MNSSQCDAREVALKSFFLGPQAENGDWFGPMVHQAIQEWIDWRQGLYPGDGRAISSADQASAGFVAMKARFGERFRELLKRFEGEVPKFSPRYVGHMFSECSLPAMLGHVVALLHNPNNISGESACVGVQIEEEAVSALREMIGFPERLGAGHFTSGGTLANFEALVRARARWANWLAVRAEHAKLTGEAFDLFDFSHGGWAKHHQAVAALKRANVPERAIADAHVLSGNPFQHAARLAKLSGAPYLGPVLLVPNHGHYSWQKGASLLGLGTEAFWSIRLDRQGKLDLNDLEKQLERAKREGRPVLMVVSVLGTTELGGFDPVGGVQDVLDRWRVKFGHEIWHHVDAAFAGIYCSVDVASSESLTPAARQALPAVRRADSVTLDPHKLGYVPYACGAFITRELENYRFRFAHDTPYIDFDASTDRGPFTIEGSRSGAGAAATWLTAKTIGFTPQGYGLLLERTTRIRLQMEERIRAAGLAVQIAPHGDSNILAFACARRGESMAAANRRTFDVFHAFSVGAKGPFTVSKTVLGLASYGEYLDAWLNEWGAVRDAEGLMLIRMCMMNPFFGSREMKVALDEEFVVELSSALKLAPLHPPDTRS